jgi:hypothetical protein
MDPMMPTEQQEAMSGGARGRKPLGCTLKKAECSKKSDCVWIVGKGCRHEDKTPAPPKAKTPSPVKPKTPSPPKAKTPSPAKPAAKKPAAKKAKKPAAKKDSEAKPKVARKVKSRFGQ